MAFSRELTLQPAGLITDPSPHSAVPPGALRTASNVVIDRDGQLEPRPGFKETLTGLSLPAGVEARFVIPFAGENFIWGIHTASGGWRVYRASDLTQVSNNGDITPPDPDRRRTKHFLSRDNLYYTSSAGIRKYTSATDTTEEPAGVFPPKWTRNRATSAHGTLIFVGTALSTGVAIADRAAVAYRCVTRREDENGYIVRSEPSDRLVVFSPYLDKDVRLSISGLPGVVAGDVIEVYRSLPQQLGDGTGQSIAPADTLYFAFEHEVTSADVTSLSAAVSSDTTNNYFSASYERLTLIDATPQGSLGAALYTNPDQSGIAAGKRRPQLAHEVTFFRGSAFYGDIQLPHRVVMQLEELYGGTNTDYLESAGINSSASATTGLGYHSFTVTTSAGTQTVTGLSATAISIITARMGIRDNTVDTVDATGTALPANTYVASVGSTSLVLSASALTSATFTAGFSDSLTIDGNWIFGERATATKNPSLGYRLTGPAATTPPYTAAAMDSTTRGIIEAANGACSGIYAWGEIASGGGQRRIIFERTDGASGAFTVLTSRPTAFTPAFTGSLLASEAEARLGGIAWSDTDEPEAVPVSNYAHVGDPGKRILRMIPTRDVLWIFKEDGLFALTGDGPDSWRVDPYDPAFRLIAPDSCAVLDERVFCLSNYGVVAVDTGGVEKLSEPFIGTDLEAYEASLLAASASVHPPSGVGDPLANRYLLSMGGPSTSGTALSACDSVYCWNTKTSAWTLWDRQPRHIVLDPADGMVLEVPDGADYSLLRQRQGTAYDFADEEFTNTVTAISTTNVTLTVNLSSSTPVAGDLLVQSGLLAHVLSVSGSVCTVDSVAQWTATTFTHYTAFTSSFEWVARTAQDPGAMKRWGDGELLMESTEDTYDLVVSTRSDISSSATSQTVTIGSLEAAWMLPVRFWVPRAHNWSSQLLVKAQITHAGSQWRCAGVTLSVNPVSARVRREYG